MKIPGLTASMVEGFAAEGSFERGRDYRDSGAVQSLRRTAEGHLEARVKGNAYVPYTVDVRYDEDGIVEVECSCPYFAGGWCKHIVAALLACLEGADVDSREDLRRAVESLDREQLVRLVESLADAQPRLAPIMLEVLERIGNE